MLSIQRAGQRISTLSNAVQVLEGPAGGVTTLIYDQCTDTNGTLLTAHTIAPTNVPGAVWLTHDPVRTLQILNSTVINTSIAQTSYYYADSLVSNVTISASLKTGGSVGGALGILGRYADLSNYWRMYLAGGGSPAIFIAERVGGVTTIRATAAAPFAINTIYAATVVMSGTTITFTVGSVTISYSSASSGLTNTAHGITLQSFSSTKNAIDDFKVETL